MQAERQAHVAFYLTGKTQAEGLDGIGGLDLRPALLAPYRDLTSLRYDFPLVLARDGAAPVRGLSELIDGVLGRIGQGADADRLTQHALRLERGMRRLVANGATGLLSALMDKAAQRLSAQGDAPFRDSVGRLRAALDADGEIVDCDAALPARLLTHLWRSVQRRKADAARAEIDRLVLRLRDILRADYARSAQGRSPASLAASVGPAQAQAFDFAAMSRLLDRAAPKDTLSKTRRQRIRWLLTALQAQAFFPPPNPAGNDSGLSFFVFDDCAAALDAYRRRLPQMIELIKATAMAKLEIAGDYSEARHDALFADFGANGLDPEEAARFPAYLVCVDAGAMTADDTAALMESLTAGLPMKILVQTDDLLEAPAVGGGHPALGARSRQIAHSAIGQGDVYVLQSTGSNLFRCCDRLAAGLAYDGPALFSIFSGATEQAGDLPPYLVAAAALEARVFPAFVYDPSRGADWASRFQLRDNPQAELDWPVQSLAFEDEAHQRAAEKLAFTPVDFLACDRRYAANFTRVARPQWNGHMVPVADSLRARSEGLPETVPCLLMVDGDNVLHKVIADSRVIREARRCQELWHSLQELGGIHNSHAERLLAQERAAWETQLRHTAEPAVAPPPPAATAPPRPDEAEIAPPTGEPSIETPRCTSCDECIQINGKMFGYDENKQAFIADLTAGTYRQLVEAAEGCQVSIIHPGKPRQPDEPGLDELIKRAEPFV